jgi:outer membrane protein assembly factor BamA
VKTRDVLLACVVLSGSVVLGQTHKLSPKELPPSAFKLIAIKVSGNKQYTEDQIVRETGLQVGQTAREDDFKTAGRLLGETGAFTDVLYSFQYSTQGTKLEFQVTEADKLVPTRFDNFVWFSDKELIEQLQKRVPLFAGKLPLAGSLVDQVSDVLQAMLLEKNVPGRVDYLRSAHQDGPIEAFVYKIVGPNVRIRQVAFSGAAPSELEVLQAASKHMHGREYSRSTTSIQAEKDLLPIYLERGYLNAKFNDPEASVAEQNEDEVLVDVNIPVEPGRQYAVSDIQVVGATVFPPTKLRERIRLAPGQPANVTKLNQDIEDIQRLYKTQGYMEASIKANRELDDAQGTVKYSMQVHEGTVYKMGDLDIMGLDSRTTARLVESWKLTGNDPYDSSYLKQFLDSALQDIDKMGSWRAATHESLNEREKTVDVVIRFDPTN